MKIMNEAMKTYKGLLGTQTRPMTDEESRLFFALTTAEMESDEKAINGLHSFMADSLLFKVLQKRLESVGLDKLVSKSLQMFVSAYADTPGQVVMWAFTLARMIEEHKRKVTLSDWTMRFPMGMPTTEASDERWDAQKGHIMKQECDNCLDDLDNWPTATSIGLE